MNRRRLALAARTALVLGILAAGSGCVSSRAYFTDRWADAKDVFTATVGVGGGAKVRVGPVQVGAFLNSDLAGLRGGDYFCVKGPFAFRHLACMDLASPIPVPCGLGQDIPVAVILASAEEFNPGLYALAGDEVPPIAERGKAYGAGCVVPFVTLGDKPYFYTQIEVAAGLGGTLRLGFNPGELLDFILGWATLDIYGDDLAARKEREEAEKKAKEKERPKEPPAPPAPAKKD